MASEERVGPDGLLESFFDKRLKENPFDALDYLLGQSGNKGLTTYGMMLAVLKFDGDELSFMDLLNSNPSFAIDFLLFKTGRGGESFLSMKSRVFKSRKEWEAIHDLGLKFKKPLPSQSALFAKKASDSVNSSVSSKGKESGETIPSFFEIFLREEVRPESRDWFREQHNKHGASIQYEKWLRHKLAPVYVADVE